MDRHTVHSREEVWSERFGEASSFDLLVPLLAYEIGLGLGPWWSVRRVPDFGVAILVRVSPGPKPLAEPAADGVDEGPVGVTREKMSTLIGVTILNRCGLALIVRFAW